MDIRIVKNTIFVLLITIIAGSSIINISNQLMILSEARKKNKEINLNILNLKKENLELKKQIEYATSSAFLEQQARDKFGLGTVDDFWLKTAPLDEKLDLFPKINNENNEPIMKQWVDLFTK